MKFAACAYPVVCLYLGAPQAPLLLGLVRLDVAMAVCDHWCCIWVKEPCTSKIEKILLERNIDLGVLLSARGSLS